MATHNNYWFQTCPTKHKVSSGLVRNVDTLIIGGGIAGISMLHSLINGGLINTYLVEESTIGSHASGRSSGQVMLRGQKLFHEYGEEIGSEYLNFVSQNNIRFLKGLRAANFDTDLCDAGGLRLAIDEDELNKLKLESIFIKKHIDINCPIVNKDELDSILPQTNFVGGMFIPTESTINPYKVINGLRELTENKGSRVLTDCQVTSVKSDTKGFSVSIRHKGIIRAKRIVYCLNAYTEELLPELSKILIPFRGQMIVTDFIDNQTMPSMSMTCNDCNEYFHMHNGHLLVGGMRHAVRGKQIGLINDGEISPGIYDKLREFVSTSLPFIKNTKFINTWSGIMCSTPDGLPLIGAVPNRPNEFIMAGFSGYGYGHALHGSMIIKELIKKGNSTLSNSNIFNPERFQSDI